MDYKSLLAKARGSCQLVRAYYYTAIQEDKEQDYFVSERRYGAFERVLQVPDDIDPESIKASFKNGVLKIELKRDKKAGAAERKIPIKAG